MSWPYLHLPAMWGFLLFVGITHYLQDWAKIRFTKNAERTLLFYLLDQCLHAFVISLVLFTGLVNLNPPLVQNGFMNIYNNNTIMLYFVAVLFASYNGQFMILLFKQDYCNIQTNYTDFEKWYGMIERTIIVTLFLTKVSIVSAVLSTLFIVIFRLILRRIFRFNIQVSDQFDSKLEMFLTGLIGLTVGIIFSLLY